MKTILTGHGKTVDNAMVHTCVVARAKFYELVPTMESQFK